MAVLQKVIAAAVVIVVVTARVVVFNIVRVGSFVLNVAAVVGSLGRVANISPQRVAALGLLEGLDSAMGLGELSG